jgi:hypothetical protein
VDDEFDPCDPLDTVLAAERRFLDELPTIDRATRFVCRRAGLEGADAEDFASFVKLKLIENDYAVIRKFQDRCSFGAYAGVVIQRLLLDHRVAIWGKWHASTEARRMRRSGCGGVDADP